MRESNAELRTVVLSGGGTGGHIFPLVSLKKALERSGDFAFAWIGEKWSLEEKTAAKEGIAFHAVKSGKLRRYFSFRTFVEPFNVLAGFFQSLGILRRLRPAFVFSKGGYVSLPVAVAAKVLGIPVYLHESDAIPGLANRWVGRFSKTVFLGFAEAAKYFPKAETAVVGQLLNPDVDWEKVRGERSSERSAPVVLVVCGSLGSSRVFEAVLEAVETLPDVRFEVVLGTLNADYRERFERFSNVTCHDFLSQSEMAEAYARAGMAVTRAGATTLGELEAAGIPMLIVPLEGSANNHQWANARAFERKGQRILAEKDLKGLSKSVSECLASPEPPSVVPGRGGWNAVVSPLLR